MRPAIPAEVVAARETAVLILLARGHTIVSAAAHLDLPESTVWKRMTAARRRVGARTFTQLLVHAIATGQVALAPSTPLDSAVAHRIETALLDLNGGHAGTLLDLSDPDDLDTVLTAVLDALTPPAAVTETTPVGAPALADRLHREP